MPDRVREALFSMLGSYYDTPGSLPPLHVADVFAGSGSMGIEALSRGASSCHFYEANRAALEALGRNLADFGIDSRACIEARSAWHTAISGPEGRKFDLILLDPPYRDAYDTSAGGPVRHYLDRLAEEYPSDLTVVLHHPKEVSYDLPPSGPWRIAQSRAFGTNGTTVFAL